MRVSVVCPVYNAPPALFHEAAASVLNEGSGHVHELILVDDASTDAATCMELVRLSGADPRVRLIRLGHNSGHSTARNAGFNAATGDWIGQIDADDLWKARWLDRAAAAAQAHPAARWIGGTYVDLFPDLSRGPPPDLDRICPGEALDGGVRLLRSEDLTPRLIANSLFHMGGFIIRTKLMRELGGFADGLHYHPDLLFAMRASRLADLHMLAEPTYEYRRGHPSMMTSPARLSSDFVRMFRLAYQDPLLMGFRRDVRWAHYSALKGLSMNNMLAGRPGAAMRFAAMAWLLDPREVRDALRFANLLARRSRGLRLENVGRYSGAERATAHAPVKAPEAPPS